MSDKLNGCDSLYGEGCACSCGSRRSSTCWWTVITALLAGLLIFSVGLIVGALLAAAIIAILPIIIALAVVWLVLLVIVRIIYRMRCNSGCGC